MNIDVPLRKLGIIDISTLRETIFDQEDARCDVRTDDAGDAAVFDPDFLDGG